MVIKMKNIGLTNSIAAVLLLAASSVSHAVLIETESAGLGQPHENKMSSLAIGYYVQTEGDYINDLGRIRMHAGQGGSGWVRADGRVLPISGNDALFSKYGTTYGGDGRTTFALPNLTNGAVVHEGHGPSLSNWSIGEQKGSNKVTLTESQMPSHDHGLPGSTDTTTQTGGDQPHSNIQQSTAVRYAIATQGIYPSRGGSGGTLGGTEPVIGEIRAFGGSILDRDWLELDGQSLSIASNTAIFSILGTTYGGDGRTTFSLPDMRGRVGVGTGTGPGLQSVRLGEKSGVETVTLTELNLPSHSHEYETTLTTDPAGSSIANENRQPYLGLNYVINLFGIYPSFDRNPFLSSLEGLLGEISMFAGDFAPNSTAPLDGQLLQISRHSALFSLLGTTYGGDGRTTFALPDLRGRTPIQVFGDFSLGSRVGLNNVTLTYETMPMHTHRVALLDNTVPVPSPLALMGLGLLGLGWSKRRRVK